MRSRRPFTLDPDTAFASAADRAESVGQWISTLTELGADTAPFTAAAAQTDIPRHVLRARINQDAKATLRGTAEADSNGPVPNVDAPENRAHLQAVHDEIRAEWGPHTRR